MTWPQKLIAWFRLAQRPLPWRKGYDPYQVWISEVMLQQTQVKTVLPYFERWMQAFPTVADLAAASEDELLHLWQGLGYYSRALNLRKAAQKIVSEFGGKIPSKKEALLSLPGVGPYTAAAIASIAFKEDEALVDGNVVRVLARVEGFKKDPSTHADWFWKRAAERLPKGEAREFNQGLMELGALICTPKNPRCSECPLQKDCFALRTEKVTELPVPKVRAKSTPIQVAIAVMERNGKVFIQKRPPTGLMAGLWEFPGGKVENGEEIEIALRRELREELGVEVENLRPFMVVKHAYTRFKVELHCFLADWASGEPELKAAVDGKWLQKDTLRNYAFPAANKKIVEGLTKN